MGERDFTWLRSATATDQRRAGRRVMGVAKGSLWPAVQRRFPADRLDCRHFQRFVLVQRWQQPGKAAGEQGLAGAGRPGEQQVVRPGRSQQQGTLGCQLPLHFAQVRVGPLLQDQTVGGVGR